MAIKSKVVETAFRLGSGRYIQQVGALLSVGEELRLLGVKHPFILHGVHSFAAAGTRLVGALREANIDAEYYEYRGFCTDEHCRCIVELDRFSGCDGVIALGGGNICDAGKLVGAFASVPVICIPTSSATCAAYTPLSVCYNERGADGRHGTP